jgi:hypothetical protein
VSLSIPPPAGADLTWAIFTPPKPFSKSTAQYAALRSWLNLRIPPRIYLVAADDLDPEEMRAVDKEFGTRTVMAKTNADGLLQVRPQLFRFPLCSSSTQHLSLMDGVPWMVTCMHAVTVTMGPS